MKCSRRIFEIIKKRINSEEMLSKARKKLTDFTRKRKVIAPVLMLYIMNRKGLTNKMEIEDFINDHGNIQEVTSSAVYKQRLKLYPEVFVYLNDEIVTNYYTESKDEVKTFKGLVLTGTDGSDWEVANTPETRKNNKMKNNQCARMKVSNCYDLLNRIILDTQIEKNKFSELALAQRHLERIDSLLGDFESITVNDRGYSSLKFMYECIERDQKFVIRGKKTDYKHERSKMKRNDEWIEIGYQKERMKHYKDDYPEFYEYFK